MNVLNYNRSLVFLILTFLFSNSALAVTYSCSKFGKTFSTTLPGYSDGGFNVVNSSCSTLIDRHWGSFGMEKKYWDDGWGFHNACSSSTPLNRTFRALELLRISTNSSFDNSIALNYAYDRSKNWIDHLRVRCAIDSDDSAAASHNGGAWGWIGGDNGSGTVYLYQNVFGSSVVSLATVLVHEARHKKKGHNGGRGCPRRASCDSSFGYDGANAYQLLYGWWYGVSSRNSTRFTRQMGLDNARSIQNRAFNTRPTFVINRTAS